MMHWNGYLALIESSTRLAVGQVGQPVLLKYSKSMSRSDAAATETIPTARTRAAAAR